MKSSNSSERIAHPWKEIITQNFMSQENEIEAKKPSPTTDFLPSDGASCSAFQWPFSPHVNAGDTIADAGCMNARRGREIKDIAQPPCPHRTVVAVFPWGLRVTNGTEESDVVDWFLPNATAQTLPLSTPQD